MTGQLITFPVRLYVRGARLLVHAAEDVTGKAVMGSLRVAGALGNLRPGGEAAPATAPSPPPPNRRRSHVRPVTGPPPGARGSSRRPRPAAPRSGATRPAARRRPAAPQPSPAATPASELPEPDPRVAAAPPADAPAPPAPPPADATRTEAEVPLASERLEQEGVVAPVDLETPPAVAPEHVSEEAVVVREEAEPGAEEGAGAAISVEAPWEGYDRLNARDVVARLTAASSAELAAVSLYESSHRKRQTIMTAVERELAKPGR